MICTQCGRENGHDAVFCQKCGQLLEAEDETRIAARDSPAYVPPGSASPLTRPVAVAPRSDAEIEPEGKVFSVSPTLKFVYAGYVLAIVGAFAFVALMSAFTPIPIWIDVLIGLLLLLIPAFYHVRQKLVNYTLTDSMVEIDSGLISRTTRHVPLRRIQDVTVNSTIAQRLLGFGDVIIDNASEEGGKVVLRNIDSPKKCADAILEQIRRVER